MMEGSDIKMQRSNKMLNENINTQEEQLRKRLESRGKSRAKTERPRAWIDILLSLLFYLRDGLRSMKCKYWPLHRCRNVVLIIAKSKINCGRVTFRARNLLSIRICCGRRLLSGSSRSSKTRIRRNGWGQCQRQLFWLPEGWALSISRSSGCSLGPNQKRSYLEQSVRRGSKWRRNRRS